MLYYTVLYYTLYYKGTVYYKLRSKLHRLSDFLMPNVMHLLTLIVISAQLHQS